MIVVTRDGIHEERARGSTVAEQKVSALDSSAQSAFLSRNLVCSFDFLVAEQFFNWMGTANLIQQSSTISKNQ